MQNTRTLPAGLISSKAGASRRAATRGMNRCASLMSDVLLRIARLDGGFRSIEVFRRDGPWFWCNQLTVMA